MRMAMCHPERKHHGKGLCAACYRGAHHASHREESRAYQTVYLASHKEQRRAWQVAYAASHKEERAVYVASHKEQKRASSAAYSASHREERAATSAAYRAAHRKEIATYRVAHRKDPARRASRFLSHNPDCTSTLEEVAAIYAASIDLTTGLPGKVGVGTNDLALDHIHGGAAIGLIPMWLNKVCTRHIDGNLDLVLLHLERRRPCIHMLALRLGQVAEGARP